MQTRIGPELSARVAAAWPVLLGAVASGANIGEACESQGVKREHAYAYMLANPEARREWEHARELSADAYADRIASLIAGDMPEPQSARVKLDALRWLAAKRNPRVYSDKQSIDLNVKTVDLTRIIQDANARLAAARQVGRVIEGAPITSALAAPNEARTINDLL